MIEKHKRRKRYSCPICDKEGKQWSMSANQLKQHMEVWHPKDKVVKK